MRKILRQMVCVVVLASLCLSATAQDFSTKQGFREFFRSAEQKKVKPQAEKMLEKVGKSTVDMQLISTAEGSFSHFVEEEAISVNDFEASMHELLGLSADYKFAKMPAYTDDLGIIHCNYFVYYRGYKVDGQMVMLHSKNGVVRSVNGIVKSIGSPIVAKKLTSEASFSIAKTALKAIDLVDKYPTETVWVEVVKDGKVYYRLSEKVKIFSLTPMQKYNVFVDVENGEVLRKVSLIPHSDVKVQGTTFFNGVREIVVDSMSSTTYYLKDNGRRISTYNGRTWDGQSFPYQSTVYKHNSKTWNVDSMKPAVQVHWGMARTHDYYLNIHGRNSYDGRGGQIYNIYNPVIYDDMGMDVNAAALGYGMMVYGRGGNYGYGYNFHPMVALDVAAHEFSHLVTGESDGGDLEYVAESGALNESFSDIFGVAVEFYALGNQANWTMGEDLAVNGDPLRSISNPNSTQLPDTYRGRYWVNTANTSENNDNGGVHTNCGPQNYWFYLLSEGGSGTNDNGYVYNVQPIGMEKAEKIAHRNLMKYLPHRAQYIDSYHGSLNAARDLYQSDPNYNTIRQSIIDAWKAVGVDPANMPCRGESIITVNSGTISEGPGKYSNDIDCSWKIQTTEGRMIKLKFTSFDIEAKSGDTYYDYVAVYDGPTKSSPLLGKFDGSQIPADTLKSTGKDMLVVFHSDEYENGEGFEAYFETYGLNELQEVVSGNGVSIYPNPAKDYTVLTSTEAHNNLTLSVVDMLGKTLLVEDYSGVSAGEELRIELKGFSQGVYMVRLEGDNGYRENIKLVVR